MKMQNPQTFSVLDMTCNDFQQLVCTVKVSDICPLHLYLYKQVYTMHCYLPALHCAIHMADGIPRVWTQNS